VQNGEGTKKNADQTTSLLDKVPDPNDIELSKEPLLVAKNGKGGDGSTTSLKSICGQPIPDIKEAALRKYAAGAGITCQVDYKIFGKAQICQYLID